ncbi:hypothetical protein E2562_023588 [Oryza meyeriana var. granulata]|uniref:Uncharacterized protein n=1 Tax=Oryza meyeriana var. granulata TaxID=110450 RepID=A0A6G1E191_9ORYZ|nr:hypothetical protein E2562_023588 [Oryza meyeriana var. granulata]
MALHVVLTRCCTRNKIVTSPQGTKDGTKIYMAFMLALARSCGSSTSTTQTQAVKSHKPAGARLSWRSSPRVSSGTAATGSGTTIAGPAMPGYLVRLAAELAWILRPWWSSVT